jgi:hypothetical protein
MSLKPDQNLQALSLTVMISMNEDGSLTDSPLEEVRRFGIVQGSFKGLGFRFKGSGLGFRFEFGFGFKFGIRFGFVGRVI